MDFYVSPVTLLFESSFIVLENFFLKLLIDSLSELMDVSMAGVVLFDVNLDGLG